MREPRVLLTLPVHPLSDAMASFRFTAAACAAVLIASSCMPVWAQGPATAGAEVRLSTSATVDPDTPSLGMSAAGAFLAAWTDARDPAMPDYKAFARRSPGTGLPLGPEFAVNTTRAAFQLSPVVGMSPDGTAMILWGSNIGGARRLFAQRYDAAGTPDGLSFEVTSSAPVTRRNQAIARGASGTTAIVWQGLVQGGADDDIYIQALTEANAPIGGEARVNTGTAGSQAFPDVAADAAGNALVVWGSAGAGNGVGLGLFGQRYSATSSPVGAEFQINTTTAGIPERPSVAVSATGAALVVWQLRVPFGSGATYRVLGRRYDASGTAVGVEFPIGGASESAPVRPSVSMDPAGTAVVVWSAAGAAAGDTDIYGQRYAADGAAVGGVFRVNTTVAGAQASPQVSVDGDGDFAVVWMSDLPGTPTIYAVVGQRFNRPGVAGEPGADAAGLALAIAPNPASGTTVVRYGTAAAQRVRVSVVDVLGRTVAVLANGDVAAGSHEARLDAAGLAPGVYVVRLDVGAASLVRRITVAR